MFCLPKTAWPPTSYELRKKLDLIEIKIDEKVKEKVVEDVKPQQKPSSNKNQVNGKVTSARGGYNKR